MASDNHGRFRCCYQNWMTQQHQDLDELLNSLTINPTNTDDLRNLIQITIKHYQDYADSRAELAPLDAPSFLCPSWCTTFENSCLWIGGCRPSLAFRIVYSICGSELEAQLAEFLQGERKGNLGEITAKQLGLINILHCKTVKEEEKLSSQIATLQEDIAEHPLLMIAKDSVRVGESSQAVDRAMDAHSVALAQVMGEADKLRLSTLKELIDILSPLQAVDLLVASKKLHLSLHEWGKLRDLNMGKK